MMASNCILAAAAPWGGFALAGALLTSMAAIMAGIAYASLRNPGLVRFMRLAQGLLLACLALASGELLHAFLTDNFKLEYVSRFSEKNLGTGFKIAAFWAGQQGSLLLWALMLAVMSVLMAWRLRKTDTGFTALTLGMMSAATGFFLCVMLFSQHGNPFAPTPAGQAIGQGLNPQLQNLAMVFHPPMLFLGYAAYTVPFAYMVAGLLTGNKGTASTWLVLARPWMVFAWIALTVGIVLGAQWAYVELGWGGYWAWDPVENASLLPWLTGTALLHSAILNLRRGMFKRWTAILTASSFFLCILGTYLTRSGVIESVHAFEQSDIGYYFLAFLGALLVGSVAVISVAIWTRRLDAEHPLEALISREGMFLIGNVLLMIMTVTVTVGTLYPLISHHTAAGINHVASFLHLDWTLNEAPVTVSGPFYNNVVLPMALVLAALMATGPVLGSGAGALEKARGKFGGMILMGMVAAVFVGWLDYDGVGALLNAWGEAMSHLMKVVWNTIRMDKTPVLWPEAVHPTWLWMQVAVFVAVAVIIGFVFDVFQSLESAGFVKALAVRHRHWGAQLAHLGLAAMIVGVAGSSVHGESKVIQLHPKDDLSTKKERTLGSYVLSLESLKEVPRANHTAVVATVILTGPKGQKLTLAPERRFYNTDPQNGSTEVALRLGVFSDVYMTLAGAEADGSTVSVTAMINPLVNWIWAGGVLLTLGGLVCMIPSGAPAGASLPAPPEGPEANDDAGAEADVAYRATKRERARAQAYKQNKFTTGRR